MTTYNTNLAAEFYVLSMLHRLGADAALTLGNRKAVDIIVVHANGTTSSIDVKGLEKKYDWPANNVRLAKRQHFYVLVSFEGKIMDPLVPPAVWIIPSSDIEQLLCKYGTRWVIKRAAVKAKGQKYRQAWSLITGESA
jgi:hypothetical protein